MLESPGLTTGAAKGKERSQRALRSLGLTLERVEDGGCYEAPKTVSLLILMRWESKRLKWQGGSRVTTLIREVPSV